MTLGIAVVYWLGRFTLLNFEIVSLVCNFGKGTYRKQASKRSIFDNFLSTGDFTKDL